MLSILCALTLSTYSQSKFNKKSKKEGCISGDCINGKGTYVYDNGEKYVGQWKDEGFHGQGTYTLPNGGKYVGEWKNDKKSGQGTFTFASGNKHVGEYKDDLRNGQGTSTYASGDKYVGENKDDMRNGQGTFTYASGDKYVGENKDDMRNGQGTFTFADGTVEKGLWEEDVYANSNFPAMKSVRDTICFYFTKLRVLEFNYQTDTIINESIIEDKYFDIEIKYGDILVLDLSDAGGESYEKKSFREVTTTYFDNTTDTEVLESTDNVYYSSRSAIKTSVGKEQFKE